MRNRLLIVLVILAAYAGVRGAEPRTPDSNKDKTVSGQSQTRTVRANVPLVHTTQLLPTDEQGKVNATETPERQAGIVLDRLNHLLSDCGASLNSLVKLNVCASSPEAAAAFRSVLARRVEASHLPAVAYVIGELRKPGAAFAVDAIATCSPNATVPPRSRGLLAILPAGPRVYVSGQAEPDKDLRAATRKTLESLDETLRFLRLERNHIVQLKAFVQPIQNVEVVDAAFREHYGNDSTPPYGVVAWRSGATVPIEIELIAASPHAGEGTIEYLTPPPLKASPVFSRVARVNQGDLIYVSGLLHPEGSAAMEQIERSFGELRDLVKAEGSDFRHLVKATYFVTDDASSRALNDIRPSLYDPERPPAASKAVVAGTAAKAATFSLDMIAVKAP